MCGRYAQTGKARRRALTLAQEMEEEKAFRAHVKAETWNLAPSTLSLVVRAAANGRLSADWLSWGFEGATEGELRPINARIETAASKPLFREAWKERRCIIPADGWYEWKADRGQKQPYYFHRRDDEPIFFAGLWSHQTFCLFTTAADGDLAQVHDRRPLTVREELARAWIEKEPSAPEEIVARAVPAAEIAFHPVSLRVSNGRIDGPDLIKEVAIEPRPDQLDLL
jgi:putative SOS response-associated peptidase YedK